MRSGLFVLVLSTASCLFADTEAVRQANELSAAFREAANRVLPATVKIVAHVQTTQERKAMQVQMPVLPGGTRDSRQPGDSTGTGVLIGPAGIVVTNNHVIARGREIEVELPDGRKYYVKKYRHDPETDLAVLWLDVEADDELPHAAFGDSDAMDIGDWVLAIGSPFELDSTVSAGIISAKGRSLRQIQRTEFLQTDAAINPGNSGGPLVNLQGEIIGINTAIASQTGSSMGIGFALPSNNAQWIVDQIIEKGKVERAWIGIVTSAVTPQEAKRLGVKPNVGVIVDYNVPGSPGEKAELMSDDVILSFDGQAINASYQLQRFSERAEIGTPHRIVLIRGGKRYAAEIEVKPMPPTARTNAQLLGGSVQSYVDNQLGMVVIQPTEAMTSRLKTGAKKGTLVWTVIPGSRAGKAGLQNGMLIVKVDGIPVPTRQDFIAAREAGSLSDGIALDVVLPGGTERKIEIKLQ